jgi:hypothetical protein
MARPWPTTRSGTASSAPTCGRTRPTCAEKIFKNFLEGMEENGELIRFPSIGGAIAAH